MSTFPDWEPATASRLQTPEAPGRRGSPAWAVHSEWSSRHRARIIGQFPGASADPESSRRSNERCLRRQHPTCVDLEALEDVAAQDVERCAAQRQTIDVGDQQPFEPARGREAHRSSDRSQPMTRANDSESRTMFAPAPQPASRTSALGGSRVARSASAKNSRNPRYHQRVSSRSDMRRYSSRSIPQVIRYSMRSGAPDRSGGISA
jgi:hypothetical protein